MGVVSLKRLRMDRVLDRGNDRLTALPKPVHPAACACPGQRQAPRFPPRNPGRRRRLPGLGVRAGGPARSNSNLAARRRGRHASGDRAGRMPGFPPRTSQFLHQFPRIQKRRIAASITVRPLTFPVDRARLSAPPAALRTRPLHGHTPSHHRDSTHLRTGRRHYLAAPPQARDHALTYEPARPAPLTIIVLRAVHVIKSGSPQEGLLSPRPAPSHPPGYSFPKRNTEWYTN
jgi:hypothetical protein